MAGDVHVVWVAGAKRSVPRGLDLRRTGARCAWPRPPT